MDGRVVSSTCAIAETAVPLARPREERSNLTKALGFVEFGIDDERLANR